MVGKEINGWLLEVKSPHQKTSCHSSYVKSVGTILAKAVDQLAAFKLLAKSFLQCLKADAFAKAS